MGIQLLYGTVTMRYITVPLGLLAAFALRLPVPAAYFVVNLDECFKLPAGRRHRKNITG